MSKMIVTVARDHAEASEILGKLLQDHNPDAPDVLETWTVDVFPCRNTRTGKFEGGKVIIAYPRDQQPSPENMLAVCYGDKEVTDEAARRGWFG